MIKDIDWIKAALLAGMGICVVLLLKQWDSFTPPDTIQPGSSQTSPTPPNLSDELGSEVETAPIANNEITYSVPAPGVEDTGADAFSPQPAASAANNGRIIEIKTDVLDLLVDLSTGDFVQADLIEFHQSLGNDTPFRILNQSANHTYIAKSGLLLNQGGGFVYTRPIYTSTSNLYELAPGEEQLVVELVGDTEQYQIIKRLIFQAGDYLVDVEHEFFNKTAQPQRISFYAQIDRDDQRPPSNTGFGMKPYVGAAITEPDNPYNKIDFDDMEDGQTFDQIDTGWVALLQHYFVSAWVPSPDSSLKYNLGKYEGKNLYYLGFAQGQLEVAAGESTSIDSGFYVGPKNQFRLGEISEYLNKTVDYGWLWWAAEPLYWVLQKTHSFVGNWGVAIILLTCLVKLAFFPLSAASYRSMARMRKLAPKMQALKERYGDDRQALSQETMKLYQKEKVNPLGGCLPILIQMPIFLALYWVLLESVEIRHAPFFLWIQDLSAKDPWYILPIIMGVSMVVQQRLNPTPPDPMQAKVMQFMPIMFAVMMAFFPAGLVLYWTVNNLLSIAQQWTITKRIEASD